LRTFFSRPDETRARLHTPPPPLTSKSAPLISPGIHEAQHEDYGLHLWYRFGVGGGPADSPVTATTEGGASRDTAAAQRAQRLRAAKVTAAVAALQGHPTLRRALELVEAEAAVRAASPLPRTASAHRPPSSARAQPAPQRTHALAGILLGPTMIFLFLLLMWDASLTSCVFFLKNFL
jgi:hypothetical protein